MKCVVETPGGTKYVIIQARSLGTAEGDLGNKKINLKTEESFKEELRILKHRNWNKEPQDEEHRT